MLLREREPPDLGVDPAEPGLRAFLARARHELHPEADAERRDPPFQDGFVQRVDQAELGEPASGTVERADPGQDDLVRAGDHLDEIALADPQRHETGSSGEGIGLRQRSPSLKAPRGKITWSASGSGGGPDALPGYSARVGGAR